MEKNLNNKDYYELIKKSTAGDLHAKFEIINIFSKLIENESSKMGLYEDECRYFIEEHIIRNIEKFKFF